MENRGETEKPRPARPPKGIVRRILRSARGLSQQGTPNSIVGFLGTWYAADQAHIVSVGVADGYRRRGIGELLLIAAVEHAIARETETITLEVRKSNAAARALYEKYGFIEQGIRKGYYSDNREDAVIMTTGSIQMERYAAQVAALKQAHQDAGDAEIDGDVIGDASLLRRGGAKTISAPRLSKGRSQFDKLLRTSFADVPRPPSRSRRS